MYSRQVVHGAVDVAHVVVGVRLIRRESHRPANEGLRFGDIARLRLQIRVADQDPTRSKVPVELGRALERNARVSSPTVVELSSRQISVGARIVWRELHELLRQSKLTIDVIVRTGALGANPELLGR